MRLIYNFLIRIYYLILQKKTQAIFILLVLIFIIPDRIFGQQQNTITTIEDLKKFTTIAYGPDNDLVNGRIYSPNHSRAKGHPYYPDKQWQRGDLYINSKKFSNYQLKYNIEIDRIILNITRANGAQVPILLNTNHIDSIQLGNHTFLINRNLISDDAKRGSFLKRINTGKYVLLESFGILFQADFTTSTPYGRYGELNRKYLIFSIGKLTPIASKKSFLRFFEDIKPEIKKYLRENMVNFNKASTAELKGLMDFCNKITEIKE